MSTIHNDPLLAELQQWVATTICGDPPTMIDNADVQPVVNWRAQAPANRWGDLATATGIVGSSALRGYDIHAKK